MSAAAQDGPGDAAPGHAHGQVTQVCLLYTSKRAIGSLVTYLMVIAAYLVCQYLLATGGMTRSLRGQLVPICVWAVSYTHLDVYKRQPSKRRDARGRRGSIPPAALDC